MDASSQTSHTLLMGLPTQFKDMVAANSQAVTLRELNDSKYHLINKVEVCKLIDLNQSRSSFSLRLYEDEIIEQSQLSPEEIMCIVEDVERCNQEDKQKLKPKPKSTKAKAKKSSKSKKSQKRKSKKAKVSEQKALMPFQANSSDGGVYFKFKDPKVSEILSDFYVKALTTGILSLFTPNPLQELHSRKPKVAICDVTNEPLLAEVQDSDCDQIVIEKDKDVRTQVEDIFSFDNSNSYQETSSSYGRFEIITPIEDFYNFPLTYVEVLPESTAFGVAYDDHLTNVFQPLYLPDWEYGQGFELTTPTADWGTDSHFDDSDFEGHTFPVHLHNEGVVLTEIFEDDHERVSSIIDNMDYEQSEILEEIGSTEGEDVGDEGIEILPMYETAEAILESSLASLEADMDILNQEIMATNDARFFAQNLETIQEVSEDSVNEVKISQKPQEEDSQIKASKEVQTFKCLPVGLEDEARKVTTSTTLVAKEAQTFKSLADGLKLPPVCCQQEGQEVNQTKALQNEDSSDQLIINEIQTENRDKKSKPSSFLNILSETNDKSESLETIGKLIESLSGHGLSPSTSKHSSRKSLHYISQVSNPYKSDNLKGHSFHDFTAGELPSDDVASTSAATPSGGNESNPNASGSSGISGFVSFTQRLIKDAFKFFK